MWKIQAREQKEKASDMRRRNEALVYNVLPVHVAEHFMGNKKRSYDELYSQSYAEVGVLFASMPNFSGEFPGRGGRTSSGPFIIQEAFSPWVNFCFLLFSFLFPFWKVLLNFNLIFSLILPSFFKTFTLRKRSTTRAWSVSAS